LSFCIGHSIFCCIKFPSVNWLCHIAFLSVSLLDSEKYFKTNTAQTASREKIVSYYKEKSTILTMNKIRDKPERIFNIDETGINTEHSPPRIVCDKSTKPQDISSTRSAAISIIAGGNSLGNYLPPYYIFPRKRWNPEFVNGSLPGSSR
jgi:hypothetical protein